MHGRPWDGMVMSLCCSDDAAGRIVDARWKGPLWSKILACIIWKDGGLCAVSSALLVTVVSRLRLPGRW